MQDPVIHRYSFINGTGEKKMEPQQQDKFTPAKLKVGSFVTICKTLALKKLMHWCLWDFSL